MLTEVLAQAKERATDKLLIFNFWADCGQTKVKVVAQTILSHSEFSTISFLKNLKSWV